jgi:crotonobetainyl-CoA:carnitine CoA-transferase CaiB-like acyl-CoA transferase
MKGPLDGIRVLDLTTMASGPLATSILGDQGADVIKLEAPGRGDALRSIGTRRGELSALFINLNRNKRSIGLSLADPRGLAVFDRLAASADVLIQNFRPGAVERMGVGPERLCSRFPRLIYVSVSGFGERGPMRDHPVYDSVMQAYSGVAAHQADPRTGEPGFVRSIVCDKGTAIQTAQIVTAALLARERDRGGGGGGGGGGQHVRVSMLHASLAFLWPDAMQNHTFLGEGASAPIGRASLPAIRATRDGHITISFIQDHEFQAFCRAVERPDLADDPHFREAGPRARHADQLQERLDPTLRRWTTEALVERLRAAEVPHAVLGEPATLHLDPQVRANELLIELDHPHAGRLRQPRPLGDFEKTPTSVRRHAPRLGEQTDEIAREAGCSDSEIETLRRAGVLV